MTTASSARRLRSAVQAARYMGKMPPPLAVFGGNRTCGKAIAARAAAWAVRWNDLRLGLFALDVMTIGIRLDKS